MGNYNIGIVTIQNLPTRKFRAMRITNQRIYLVGTGLEEPLRLKLPGSVQFIIDSYS